MSRQTTKGEITMDFQVPLNRLIFGQEDGAGINARVTGRDDGIAELAANIHVRGQIENLVVKRVAGIADELYSVSNGNRRLAALHMIFGNDSAEPIRCTLRDVDEDGAFEDSLTTAVTARQLHPVDQYEAFARLRDKAGSTIEEIARRYGMSEREVEQALALGHLSPRIRDAWRKGELKTEVAKVFTLAPDHKTQDEVLSALTGEHDGDACDIETYEIKEALKIGNDDSGRLVEFVGIDAYVARGGKVTRDFFGTDHKVSDPKLAKAMAAERLKAECDKLKKAGWSFALSDESVRNTRHTYAKLKAESSATEAEAVQLDELDAIFNPGHEVRHGHFRSDSFFELSGVQQQAYLAYRELDRAIKLRAYTPKMMEKAGCFIGINDDGFLDIEYGYVKPEEKKAAAKIEQQEKRETAKAAATVARAVGKPAPESSVLSNALKQRLEAQLIAATRDAIAADPLLSTSPLAEVLAKTICAQIVPDRPFSMPDAVRTKLPSIRQALAPEIFKAAMAKRFEAENYFSSAPKAFVVRAIAEAINPDEARKASSGKTQPEIWKFALANLGKTGWLPKELRTVHYNGPGSEAFKKPTPKLDERPRAPSTREVVAQAKQDRAAKAGAVRLKRAAATKKSAKKVSSKRKG
jgi:ParB family chromosome partitioning protein